VRSSVPVAASPENSAARAAMLLVFVLLMVIDVPLGTPWTACFEQMAARMLIVVT
jgi:hypothetical protein